MEKILNELPEELVHMLKAHDAFHTFMALKPKARDQYLQWINGAKKEETKSKRIEKVAIKVAGR